MKCPNCKNEIEVGGFQQAIPIYPKAKWYQYINYKYRGFGIETVPKKLNAKWYQFTDTKVLCDNCGVELEIDLIRKWPRYTGIWLASLPIAVKLFIPELMDENLWLWPLLFIPSVVMLIIAKKVERTTIRIKADK